MFQKISLQRIEVQENNEVIFEATIEKAKGALHLEGKKYTVARVQSGATKWFGLHEMYEEMERATQPE